MAVHRFWGWLGAFCVVAALPAGAGVAVEEALETPLERPIEVEASLDLLSVYEEHLPQEAPRTLREEIDVDLIDLETLRGALEFMPDRERLRLSLEESLLIALERNQDILVTAYEPDKSAADVYSARGEFDPVWQTTMNYIRSMATASQDVRLFGGIDKIEAHRTNFNSQLGGRLSTGMTYGISYDVTREQTTFGRFVEEYDATLSFTLTQPLLRGFGRTVNKVRIRAAENARQMSEEQLRLSVMNVVADVTRSYWDLVGTIEALRVQQASLANAERLLRVNETRRDIGAAADIEVLQAKAGVATRQSELIAARARVNDAEDVLKQLLDMREGDFLSRVMVIPVDRPAMADPELFDAERYEESVERSVARALEHRPEMSLAQLEIATAELDEIRARDEMRPQFDLTASVGQGGRDGEFRRTFYRIRDRDDDFYSYGFQATVPLGNRAARGQHQRARLSTRQAEQRREQARNSLMLQVKLAARNVMTNQTLIESHRQASRLQEANVLAEEQRLRLGVTTSWQLLRVQEDLTAAQTQEVQARIAYERALIELQLAEGTILENYGVSFEVPDTDRPIGYFNSIRPRWE